MKSIKLLQVAVLMCFTAQLFGQSFPSQYLKYNGDPSQKVNIVMLPDGYTASEMNKFISDAQSVVSGIFNEHPFSSLESSFNVIAVKVPSNQSGAGYYPNVIDNYFGSCFNINNTPRLLAPTKSDRVQSVLTSNFPQYDLVLIQVNSTTYGGSGGAYATYSLDPQSRELALHESGHTYGSLADEYWAGAGYAAEKPNMTQNNNPATIKWKIFLYQQGVGIYPYEESPNWYRPHQNCKMRYLGSNFCLVCQNRITQVTEALVGNGGGSLSVPTGLTASNITSTSFTASWNAVQNATIYDLQRWNGSAWSNAGSGSSTSYNFSGLTANGTEYVRVRARNSTSTSDYSNYITVVLTGQGGVAPATPVNLSVSNIGTTSFTGNWGSVANATGYNVQLWSASSSSWIDKGSISATSYQFTGLAAGSDQYFRVQATNQYGSSDYSAYQHVLLNSSGGSAPPVPSNTRNIAYNSTGFFAAWDLNAESTDYTVQKWVNGSWVVQGATTDYYYYLTGSAGSTIYWRVRANNSSGSSDYSNWISYTLPSPPPVASADIANNFVLYPIPCNSIIYLSCQVKDNFEVKIFDISGKLKMTKEMNHTNEIDISGLNKGIYLIQLKFDSQKTITKRFIKD